MRGREKDKITRKSNASRELQGMITAESDPHREVGAFSQMLK